MNSTNSHFDLPSEALLAPNQKQEQWEERLADDRSDLEAKDIEITDEQIDYLHTFYEQVGYWFEAEGLPLLLKESEELRGLLSVADGAFEALDNLSSSELGPLGPLFSLEVDSFEALSAKATAIFTFVVHYTLVSTIGNETFPDDARRTAAWNLIRFTGLAGNPVHRRRWLKVKPALKERARNEGSPEQEILAISLEEAVFAHVPSLPIADVSAALIRGESIPVRPNINNWIAKDFLGPDWRNDERSEELKAKVDATVRNRLAQSPSDTAQRTIIGLYTRDLLSRAGLSNRERRAVVLAHLEDLSTDAIADEMEIAPSTVRTYIQRAHRKLRAVAR